ncbi:MAG: hypothetical protein U0736_06185 [Gemmataceae bacterium]
MFFPFDLFGSPGAAAGPPLVAEAVREILADNRRETAATRARAYTPHVRLREVEFGSLDGWVGGGSRAGVWCGERCGRATSCCG